MKTSDRWVLTQWVLVALLGLSLLAPRSPQLTWARPFGAALAVVGALLVGVSAYTYRAVNRTIFQASPEPKVSTMLVEVGIYSLVRHPVYTGVILGAFGLALFVGSFWSGAAASILSTFYYFKSRYEEGLLLREFPGYAAYRERTRRFLPGLPYRKSSDE